MAIPPGLRRQMVSQGTVDPLLGVLTPGQRVSLFPNYFKDSLSGLAGQRSEFGGIPSSKFPSGVSSKLPRTGNTTSVDPSILPQAAVPATSGAGTPTGEQGPFTARERRTLDFIAKREGATDPNIIFGGNRYKAALGLDKKPLTQRTVAEVFALQGQLRQLSKADGYGKNDRGEVLGTSAVGSGQMIEGTLRSNLLALGYKESDFSTLVFDKTLQEKLTLQNFKSSGIGDPNADPSTWNKVALGNQYESLNARRGFSPMSQEEIQAIAAASPDLQLDANSTASPVAGQGSVMDDTLPIGNNATAVPMGVVAAGSVAEILDGTPVSAAQQAVDRSLEALGLNERENKELLKDYLSGKNLDPEKTAWCANFVNTSLASAGLRGTGSNIANSFQNYGTGIEFSNMTKGDIVVDTDSRRADETGGHVMQATGRSRINERTGELEFEVVGGNQSDAVTTRYISQKSDIMVRRSTEANLVQPPVASAVPGITTAPEQPVATQTETNIALATAQPTSEPSTLGTDLAVGAATLPMGLARGAAVGAAHWLDTDTSKPGNSSVGAWVNENIPGAKSIDDLAYRATGGLIGTSADDPRYSSVPTSSMAAGGMIAEPHTAINDRTGEKTRIGEKGTGGEFVVPRNKVDAAELGQQSYQMPQSIPQPSPREPTEAMIEKAQPAQRVNATGQQAPSNGSVSANHPVAPPSARKAYADAGLEARFNNFSPLGTQYRSFGA